MNIKLAKIFVFLTLTVSNIHSQNILKNPDFEQFTPTIPGEALGKHWDDARSTYDYINTTYPSRVFPSFNGAYSGTGYIGIAAGMFSIPVSEAIGQNIGNNPIRPELTYEVQISAKLTHGNCYSFNQICGGISVYGTETPYVRDSRYADPSDIPGIELLWTSANVSDSNWQVFKGCFKSKKLIKYVIIAVERTFCKKYVFIDSVSISPVIDLGKDTIVCGESAFLINPNFANGLSYKWSDNSTSPTLLVNKTGVYWAEVMSSCGIIRDYISVTYKYCGVISLEMPNVFTPNGDGINDYFKPTIYSGIVSSNFQIFNRWGQLVFESNISEPKWNGKSKDKKCSEGVYFWVIKYIDKNGENHSLKGNVSLT